MASGSSGLTASAAQRDKAVGRTALKDPLQIGLCDPEVPLRLDGTGHRLGLAGNLTQQVPHALEHAVVVKNSFFGDELANLQDLVA